MSTIIDQNINMRNTSAKCRKKLSITLIADNDLNLWFCESEAVWIDIDTINQCIWTKVMLPHLKRSTL